MLRSPGSGVDFLPHLVDLVWVPLGLFMKFTVLGNLQLFSKALCAETNSAIIAKMIMAIFGHFMVKLYLNCIFNGLIVFSASDWYNKSPISLFEISKLEIFMISGFPDLLLIAFIGQLMALLANEWLY